MLKSWTKVQSEWITWFVSCVMCHVQYCHTYLDYLWYLNCWNTDDYFWSYYWWLESLNAALCLCWFVVLWRWKHKLHDVTCGCGCSFPTLSDVIAAKLDWTEARLKHKTASETQRESAAPSLDQNFCSTTTLQWILGSGGPTCPSNPGRRRTRL